jgi:hypothetical protein
MAGPRARGGWGRVAPGSRAGAAPEGRVQAALGSRARTPSCRGRVLALPCRRAPARWESRRAARTAGWPSGRRAGAAPSHHVGQPSRGRAPGTRAGGSARRRGGRRGSGGLAAPRGARRGREPGQGGSGGGRGGGRP